MMNSKQNALMGLLLSSFPNFQSGDAESALAAYEIAISDYHADDVADAVKAFVQGRVPGHNMAFAPTAPHLATACRRAMDLRLDEANRHRKAVLQIEAREDDTPKNAENRARVKTMMADALKNLEMHDEPKRQDNEARRADMMRRHDETFAPTLRYTAGSSEDEGDMGGLAAR